MGHGIAKVDQQTITEILCDMPAEALDDLGTGRLIGPHDLAQLLRVEPFGEGRGAHQITEHHGELAAFGVGGRWSSPCGNVLEKWACVGVRQRRWLRRHRRSWRYPSVSGPHQHLAIQVGGYLVDLDEFLLEGAKGVVIQGELDFERSIG